MPVNYNLDEIFQMAEQIEKNGKEFYESSAASISDPEKKKMLISLAKMEEKHIERFAKMRKKLQDIEIDNFDPENEASMYLSAMANTKVFFEKTIDTTSMESILKEAIISEKDSIAFYLGMKDLVPEELGKDNIDEIIKEEMRHITFLSNELTNLNK